MSSRNVRLGLAALAVLFLAWMIFSLWAINTGGGIKQGPIRVDPPPAQR